jgi:hypothetical protein
VSGVYQGWRSFRIPVEVSNSARLPIKAEIKLASYRTGLKERSYSFGKISLQFAKVMTSMENFPM